MQPVIVSLGEVLWDLFDEGARFGGAPANFACHAAILGARVSMVSGVGDDDRGRTAVELLQRYGVDVSLIQTVAETPTGSVTVSLDENRKPTFTIHSNSAWDHVTWSPQLDSKIAESNAVYFGTLGQRHAESRSTIRKALATALEAGIPRILDINLRSPFFDADMIRESIGQASILKLSDDELDEACAACGLQSNGAPEKQLELLRKLQDLDLVIMTCGAKGAMLVSPGETIVQPGIPTTVRDTVGAGDSFAAAFLYSLLSGESHANCLYHATSLAAKVCSSLGAVPEP